MQTTPLFCGIDVGLKTHKVCVLGPNQESIAKFVITNDRTGFERLETAITRQTKICLEPTGVYSINLFLYFKKRGHDIRFCGTVSSKHFREAMYKRKKHDNLDCVSIAKYRIVNEHLTFDTISFFENLCEDAGDRNLLQLRSLLEHYQSRSKVWQRLKNQITALIDLRFPEAVKIFGYERSCKSILTLLQHSKKDVLAGKIPIRRLAEITPLLEQSIGQYDCKTSEFNALVTALNELEKETKQLRTSISEKLKEMGYSKFLEYCGISEINAGIIICDVRNISRFHRYNANGSQNTKRSLRAFKNFLGMTVTSNQSGEHEGGHRLIRFASKRIRTILFMLSLTYISMQEEYRDRYNGELNPYKFKDLYTKYSATKPKMVAITKIMSKIAIDLFFVLSQLQPADSQTTPYTAPIPSQQCLTQTSSTSLPLANSTTALS